MNHFLQLVFLHPLPSSTRYELLNIDTYQKSSKNRKDEGS